MQFFDKNWITSTIEEVPEYRWEKRLVWRMADNLEIPTDVGISSIVRAVKRMKLGSNPYVALSGGIDSQVACLALKEAGIHFKAATMIYNGLNQHDVENAVAFAQAHNLDHQLFPFDVVKFLKQDLHNVALRYRCSSPHFNTHFKFYERLISDGATSIIAGGQSPRFLADTTDLIYDCSSNQNAWTNFVKLTEFPLYGNFLGWSFDIAAPYILAHPQSPQLSSKHEERIPMMESAYAFKAQAFQNLGFEILPQKKNNTGFENVKLHFEEETGDVIFFEKNFRIPYERLWPNLKSYLIQPNIKDPLILIKDRTCNKYSVN